MRPRLQNTFVSFNNDCWVARVLVSRLLPTLKWRHHGIGVLQAYVHEGDRELRIHVWSPRLMLPGIQESGNVHNHRFILTSTVLLGSLLHTEYQLDWKGSGYELYSFPNARKHNDENRTLMTRVPSEVGARQESITLTPGCCYTFNRGAFHSSQPLSDIVVTLVEKTDQVEEQAQVLAPVGCPPVPAFSGDYPEDLKADILAEAEKLLLHEGSLT